MTPFKCMFQGMLELSQQVIVVAPLAWHPTNQNAVIVLQDLSGDM